MSTPGTGRRAARCRVPPSPTPRRAGCRPPWPSWRRWPGARTTGRGAYLDVSVADGVLWLTSLAVDEQLALGGDVRPGHDMLSGRYACYDTYAGSDGEWLAVGAIEAKFFANLCRRARVPASWRHPARRRRPAGHPGRVRRRVRHPDPRRVGGRAGRRPTPASRRCSRSPRWLSTRSSPPGRSSGRRRIRRRARCRQLGPLLAGMERPATGAGPPVPLPDMTQTDTEHLLKEAGVDGETVARWVRPGVVA